MKEKKGIVVEKGRDVKVVFMKKIWRKHNWYVPIVKERDGVFLTGQDLPYAKMIGEEMLTDGEKKQYPFVIDPTEHYRIIHGQRFNTSEYYDRMILQLALNSSEIAESLSAYKKDPQAYVGYVEDNLAEARAYNETADLKYEADTLIRNLPISDFRRVALLVNYTMGKHINVDSMPEDYIKAKLLEAANEDPDAVLKCFPKHNPGIEEDLYILELIKYKILYKKPNNEIYDGDVYVGQSLGDAKNFLHKSHNAGYVNKWKHLLDKAKGIASDVAIDKLPTDSRADEYKEIILKVKEAIFDEKVDKAEYYFDKAAKEYAGYLDNATESSLLSKINDLKSKRKDDNDNKKKEQFKKELEELEVKKLQEKIKHAKSPYDGKQCEEFWNDKSQLIEYMIKVKFPE